jgi:cell division septal protein FtsQ
MTERTKYQQNIIRNYYENRDTISLQRAQEIVTDLYLSEGKKRLKYWESLAKHLEKLGVKPAVVKKLIQDDDPQAAAQLITNLGKDG